MKLVKGLLRWLSSVIFHLSLFMLIGSIGITILIGNPAKLKNIINDSGAYQNVIESIIATNIDNFSKSNDTLPLSDPEIQNIVRNVFTPEVLKEKTELFIDSVYSWLDKSSDNLEFSIDFTKQRDELFDGLSTYAATRLSGLPACTLEDLQATNNVFNLECQPPGFYENIVKTQVLGDLNNSDFLKNPEITENNLPKTADESKFTEKFHFMPLIYSILQNGIIIFGGFFVLCSLIYLLARLPFRKGFKSLGRDLLGNGVMLVIFTALYSALFPKITSSFKLQITSSGNEAVEKSVNYFVHSVDVLVINIAIQIAVVGLLILIIEKMTRPTEFYAEVAKKSGLLTSEEKKTVQLVEKSDYKNAPVQTSEPANKRTTKRKTKTKKKIQL